MKLSGNKILPLLAGVTALSVLLIVLYINNRNHHNELKPVTSSDVQQLDGDLPEHTLNKLTANMAEFNEQLKGNNELVKDSVDQFSQLKREIEVLKSRDHQLSKELESERERIKNASTTNVMATNVDELTKRVMNKLKSLAPDQEIAALSTKKSVNYPVRAGQNMGLGSGQTHRIHGLDAQGDNGSKLSAANLLPDFNSQMPQLSQLPGTPLTGTTLRVGAQNSEPPTPVYTLPDLSILNDATAVTHLIGRIPIKGDVTDPAPFKVIIGRDNLAANGHNIPGVEGMFMEGHVWGDATLSCVRAYVERASFVFTDGTIVSYPPKNGSKKETKTESIGYLTDEFGSTCIPGLYITNAPRTLTAQFLADLAAGAADAYANKETTSMVTTNGGINSAVTGSDGKYVLGQALSEGGRGISEYIRSRNLDIWDSVLVKAGQKVAIHLQAEIPIDYSKYARKLSYYSQSTNGMTD